MQEPLKFPTSPRTQAAAEDPLAAPHVPAIPEETTPEPVPPSGQLTEPERKAPPAPRRGPEQSGSPDAQGPSEVSSVTDLEEADAGLRLRPHEPQSPQPYSSKLTEPNDRQVDQKLTRFASPFDTFKMPAMAVVTAASLVAAVWTYSVLEETRSQLSSVSTAKAASDRALANAEAKLAAAEKAVANVKEALTGLPSSSSPEQPKPNAAPSSKTAPHE